MTKKNSSVIFALRAEMEQVLGRKLKTPNDFMFCVGAIWEKLHQNLSPTTLKRLWGYIDGADTTRLSTLNILSQFLGYSDWEDYLVCLEQKSESQSGILQQPQIAASDLQKGTQIEIQWQPNRRCVLEYLGENSFVVLESEHSKLQKGNTFECLSFYLHQPLYIDNLIQDNNPPVSFVVGKRDGLTVVRKVE